jgi:transposase-like protein
MTKKCKTYDPKIKAKIALEVLSGGNMLEICTKNNIPKTNLREWRDKLVNEASNLFVPASEQNKLNKAL